MLGGGSGRQREAVVSLTPENPFCRKNRRCVPSRMGKERPRSWHNLQRAGWPGAMRDGSRLPLSSPFLSSVHPPSRSDQGGQLLLGAVAQRGWILALLPHAQTLPTGTDAQPSDRELGLTALRGSAVPAQPPGGACEPEPPVWLRQGVK